MPTASLPPIAKPPARHARRAPTSARSSQARRHRRILPLSRTKRAPRLVLAGDVGGTKCNLALFAIDSSRNLKPAFQRRFATKDYESSSFDALLSDFLKTSPEKSHRISHAAFASAGMLVKGKFKCVNVPWPVNAERIAKKLKLTNVGLLNDLEASALSLSHLPARDFLVLNKGVEQARAPKALLAAGTGLGESILIWEGDRYRALPSEGGQVDFAPRNDKQIDLLRSLRRERANVCCEDVLSGRGFRRIHEFLSSSVRHASFDGTGADAAGEITRLALARECSVCVETLDMWVSIYGAEAGDLALKVLAFGGVYIAGGIALKILAKLKDGDFFRAFCDKANNLGPLLARVPIRVVLNEDAPLLGAAITALSA